MEDRGFSDLLSTATKILNSDSHSSNPSHGQKPTSSSSSSSDAGMGKPGSHPPKASYTEIYSSAQVVMNAAKQKLHKTEDSSSAADVDVGKLAGAAGTLLGAVSHYGKLDQSSYGKYAQKAQDYLRSYETKHGKPGSVPSSQIPNLSEQHGHAPSGYTPSEQGHSRPSSTHATAGHGHSEPTAPPGYTPSEHGHGRPSSTYATSGHGYSEASAPAMAYPPSGYPDSQQGHGYGHQGRYESSVTQGVAGYPPAGYPISGGTHKYS